MARSVCRGAPFPEIDPQRIEQAEATPPPHFPPNACQGTGGLSYA